MLLRSSCLCQSLLIELWLTKQAARLPINYSDSSFYSFWNFRQRILIVPWSRSFGFIRLVKKYLLFYFDLNHVYTSFHLRTLTFWCPVWNTLSRNIMIFFDSRISTKRSSRMNCIFTITSHWKSTESTFSSLDRTAFVCCENSWTFNERPSRFKHCHQFVVKKTATVILLSVMSCWSYLVISDSYSLYVLILQHTLLPWWRLLTVTIHIVPVVAGDVQS